ncbi:unnamed protein product, partial [Prunus brigantina]
GNPNHTIKSFSLSFWVLQRICWIRYICHCTNMWLTYLQISWVCPLFIRLY